MGRCTRTSILPWPLHTALFTDASKLIRSPAFNRAVQKAYRKIHRLPDFEQKNGGGSRLHMSPPETHRLTALLGTGPSSFDHFKDEVKNQFRELTWQKRPRK